MIPGRYMTYPPSARPIGRSLIKQFIYVEFTPNITDISAITVTSKGTNMNTVLDNKCNSPSTKIMLPDKPYVEVPD